MFWCICVLVISLVCAYLQAHHCIHEYGKCFLSGAYQGSEVLKINQHCIYFFLKKDLYIYLNAELLAERE